LFQGVLNTNSRLIIASYIPAMPPNAVILCSGNFSVESTLRMNGYEGTMKGCDVTLHSCMAGAYLSGNDLEVGFNSKEFPDLSPLAEYLDDMETRTAIILIAEEIGQFYRKRNRYEIRNCEAILRRLPELVEKTVLKLQRKKESIGEYQYFGMDAIELLAATPDDPDHIILTFPPSYSGDYEKMFKFLDDVFPWEKPDYKPLTSGEEYASLVTAGNRQWIYGAEHPTSEIEEILGEPISKANRSRLKDIFLYTNMEVPSHLIRRKFPVKVCDIERMTDADEITEKSKIWIHKIPGAEANYIRQLYLARNVTPSSAMYNYGVIIDGKLAGIVSFDTSTFDLPEYTKWEKVYLLGDLPVSGTRYKNLAKLIATAALSSEMQRELESIMITELKVAFTTVFSDKPSSMKYRGAWKVYNRKEGVVNYLGKFGRWDLKGAMLKWLANQRKLKAITKP